jgi:hypothetical protein
MFKYVITSANSPRDVLVRMILTVPALAVLVAHPLAVFGQSQEVQRYREAIARDPRAATGQANVYEELIRQGKDPLRAFRAAYIYCKGFELGYYYGYEAVYAAATRRPPDTDFSIYHKWEDFYKQQPWSSGLWGWYQQAYLDGQTRGMAVAQGRETGPPGAIPAAVAGDVGRYARSLPSDPDDPFGDLRIRSRITGPR